MKDDNATSASSSGGTSATKPPPPEASPEKLTESQYLEQQAHNARLAMSKALAELKVRLGQGVAPQAWAREYPWVTVGAATVAGFVTAAALIPSKEQQALKKLAAIERALNPPRPKPEPVNGDGKKETRGTLASILHEIVNVARPALVSLISAGLAQQPQPPEPPDGADVDPDEQQEF